MTLATACGVVVRGIINAARQQPAIEMVNPFGRGQKGYARLTIAKDRPAWLDCRAVNKVIAEFHVDSAPDGTITAELRPPGEPDAFRPTIVMEQIAALLEANPAGVNKRGLRDRISGRAEIVDLAVALLVEEGYVRVVPGKGAERLHQLVKPFTADSGP